MHALAKTVTDNFDKEPHVAEKHLLATFHEADSEVGTAVAQARSVGLPWATIIALLIQYGPQFAAIIQAIIAALNTTPPPRMAEPQEEESEEEDKPKRKRHK